ncbi:MAG: hypothetical protein RR049_05885 [Angelakisella sp.]
MREKNEASGEQLSAILKAVAGKMGKTPEALERELKNGIYPNERAKEILGNKQELEALLESPQVKQLLRELDKKK